MSDWEYRGRWALVTGASSGIGEAFAVALAGRGMNLVLAARREDRLQALAARLRTEHSVEAVVVPADLAKPGGAGVLWMEASDERPIHLLVNNAGFGLKGEFHDLSAERQTEMVRVNCVALLELAHFAVGDMRGRGGGGIINVASIAGYQPIPMLATYAASKAFVLTLSEALAEENREAGVRVVTLNPGPVATEFQDVAGTIFGSDPVGLRTADEVVAAALAGLERGERTVTPGMINRISTYAARVSPRGLAIRAAKTIMRRSR